jgi:hypothetical protein
MTRRDFFQRLFPWRASDPTTAGPESVAESPGSVAMREREIFLEAMRLGIDPATVDPRRLEELVAGKASNHPTTDDKGASGSDLAGLPDALRRPQQRGGPDGDQRHPVFLS